MNGSNATTESYHRQREHQERAAADRAVSEAARRVHQELADRHAALGRA